MPFSPSPPPSLSEHLGHFACVVLGELGFDAASSVQVSKQGRILHLDLKGRGYAGMWCQPNGEPLSMPMPLWSHGPILNWLRSIVDGREGEIDASEHVQIEPIDDIRFQFGEETWTLPTCRADVFVHDKLSLLDRRQLVRLMNAEAEEADVSTLLSTLSNEHLRTILSRLPQLEPALIPAVDHSNVFVESCKQPFTADSSRPVVMGVLRRGAQELGELACRIGAVRHGSLQVCSPRDVDLDVAKGKGSFVYDNCIFTFTFDRVCRPHLDSEQRMYIRRTHGTPTPNNTLLVIVDPASGGMVCELAMRDGAVYALSDNRALLGPAEDVIEVHPIRLVDSD